MKVAIVGAGFSPAEAGKLRRAIATFKLTGGVGHFYDKLENRQQGGPETGCSSGALSTNN